MSDFALKLHFPPDEATVAHGSRWLWTDEAAPLLGMSEGNLRRVCATKWAEKGWARQARRDKQMRWQVCEHADARLARVAATPQAAAMGKVDVSTLTEKQRQEFARRLRLLTAWRAALDAKEALRMPEAEITERFCAAQAKLGVDASRGTLYRWRSAYDHHGERGLLHGNWITNDARGVDDRFAETLKRLYLDQRKRSVRICWEIACEAVAEEMPEPPGYKTAQRIINAIDREVVELRRNGRKSFEDNVETYVDRDYSTLASNETWCSDHHRFDVFVRIETPDGPRNVRPWLHAWQDMRSRRIVGWSIFAGHDPNAEIIVRTFCGAVRACGHLAPQGVYLDNGKDFDSRILGGQTKRQRQAARLKPAMSDEQQRRLGGVFGDLDVNVQHTWVYHGQSKPIERWFGTVCQRFSKLWDSYCGKDTLSKPDDLAAKLERGAVPTLAELTDAFDAYVRDDHNARTHMGDSMHGKTPDQVWREQLTSPRPIVESHLAFAAMTKVEVTVRQNAIVQLPGYEIRFGRGEPQLIDRIGQQVILAYDTDNVTEAILVDPTSRQAICKLAARDKLPANANAQQMRAAMAEKKQVRRRVAAYGDARPRIGLDVPELALQAAARTAQATREIVLATGTDDATPSSFQLVQTPRIDNVSNVLRSPAERASTTGDVDSTENHGRFRYVRPERTEEEARDE